MKGELAIANILKKEETDYLFCYPANTLIEAAASLGIEPIMSRTERATVNMADGYTRTMSGKKNGIVVTQTGPGIENAFSGVAHAFAESVPIFVIPGGTANARLGQSPDFRSSEVYRPVTKWSDRINQLDRIPEMMRRGFTYLRSGRGRPVLLEVAQDVAQGEFDDSKLNYEKVKFNKTAADPNDIRKTIEMLLKAKNPVLYAGAGILWAEATSDLIEFAELLNAPVLTSNTGKSGFPEDHPLSLGTGGNTYTKAVKVFLDKSDLIFGLGCSFTTNLASIGVPTGKTLIQANVDEIDLNKEQQLDHSLMGDLSLVLPQLIEELKKQAGEEARKGTGNVEQEIKKVKDEWLDEWMPLLTSNEAPINPYRIIWDFMNTVDRSNTILTHESGHPRDQTIPFYQTVTPRSYMGWANSSQLGYSLGISMGAKLAAPDKTVATIMGDASIGMCGMDIETAVRHKIPVLLIVFNNHVLSGYSVNYPKATENFGFTNLYGEYAKLATALGAHGERVEDPSEIIPSIKRAQEVMNTGKPVLLEFMTKEENRLCRG